MSLFPDYTTSSALKARLGITDSNEDTEIALAVSVASRMVDGFCHRQFGSSAGEVREYPIMGRTVSIDDYVSATEVAVRPEWGTTTTALVAGEGYRFEPMNASSDGSPFTRVALAAAQDGVLRVTGTLGWSSVPDVVEQATLIQALRIYRRSDAPFGIAGSPEAGTELRLLARVDPDVQVMLVPYKRNWGAV